MFTANSMNCLLEAIGLALPGNGTIPAVDPRRHELARAAARQIFELLERDIKPRDIVTKASLDNAFALDMAMGGSTNTVLHGFAIAHEAGVDYPLERLNEISARHALHLQGVPLRARRAHPGRGPGGRHQRHPEGDRPEAGRRCTSTA